MGCQPKHYAAARRFMEIDPPRPCPRCDRNAERMVDRGRFALTPQGIGNARARIAQDSAFQGTMDKQMAKPTLPERNWVHPATTTTNKPPRSDDSGEVVRTTAVSDTTLSNVSCALTIGEEITDASSFPVALFQRGRRDIGQLFVRRSLVVLANRLPPSLRPVAVRVLLRCLSSAV